MVKRNFSPEYYYNLKAQKHRPVYHFTGKTPDEWRAWYSEAYDTYKKILGDFPVSVPLNPVVESVEDLGDIIRERVIIDAEENMSVPCYVLHPKDMPGDKSGAAIVCSHGHGKFGKEPVAGVRATPEMVHDIEEMNYNYGEKMARAGFLTICPDLRGFGERSDGDDPLGMTRDMCNINFLKGALFGSYPLTQNIFDITRCIDYLETRPEVNKERIGMMGLSQGGTMTTFASAFDKRIKAADIICYVTYFAGFAVRDTNFCGSQMIPNVYKYFDASDIAGLIAPRPLLIERGLRDRCFVYEDTTRGFTEVEKIYEAAGCRELLWSDVGDVGHAFCDNRAYEFFKKYL